MITNHLQEYKNSSICYGLYHVNELNKTQELVALSDAKQPVDIVENKQQYQLVALMSFGMIRFGKQQDKTWEMLRFCIKKNTKVYGAASKLFNHFLERLKPNKVISYANCDWSINSESNVYQKLGFKYIRLTEPDYSLLIGKTRSNRQNYTKQLLIKKYNCPEDMTEHEYTLRQGWYRIYGTGNLVYEWNSK